MTNSPKVQDGSFEQRLRKIPYSGILLAALSGLISAFPNFTVKLLSEIHSVEILLIRSIIQLLVCAIFLIIFPSSVKGKGERWPLLVSGIFGCLSYLAGYTAFKLIPLGDATAIIFSAPVYVSLFACLLLSEAFGVSHCSLMFITLSGIVLISKPTFIFGIDADDVVHGLEGYLLAFFAAVTLALSFVYTRKIQKTSSDAATVWFSGVIIVLSAIYLAVLNLSFGQSFKSPTEFSTHEWLLLMVNGVGGAFSQLCLTLALKIEEAGVVSLTRCDNIVLAYILQVLFLSEAVHWTSMLGAAIVLSGVALTCIRKIIVQRRDTAASGFKPPIPESKA
ncbi:Solute carrier family 35 member G1 [Halotydeus destructor]|nr:Solute carrier family 35 member G1 [Halotydeus destructor]